MPLLFERGGPSKFTMVSVNYSYIEVKAWMFLPVLLCPDFSLCSGMSADNASYSINHKTVTEREKAGQKPSGGKCTLHWSTPTQEFLALSGVFLG